MIDPFGLVFRLMTRQDPDFLQKTGLVPGSCGDDADSHAGTNETSLMLAACPEYIHLDPGTVEPSLPPAPLPALKLLARFLGVFSLEWERDVEHLANLLAWTKDPGMLPYMGCPARASAKSGESMLNARMDIALQLFRRALRGETVPITPMLWWLRFLLYLPE